LSPGKTSVKQQIGHSCVCFTDKEIAIKTAKQSFKHQITNPNSFSTPIQSMFQSMTQDLMAQDGMRYEDLEHIMKPYQKSRSSFQKLRAKVYPRENPSLFGIRKPYRR